MEGTAMLLKQALKMNFIPVCRHSKKWKGFYILNACNLSMRSLSSEVPKEKITFEKPSWVEFGRGNHGSFSQQKPKLANTFLSDQPLQDYLKRFLPKEVENIIFKDLEAFGSRIVEEIDDIGWECEVNPPYLRTRNAWGTGGLELVTCNAWKKQRAISAEEGIVAIAYEKKLDHWSRFYQICKLFLYAPSSGLYSCPLAMTDGAAKILAIVKDKINGEKRKDMLNKAFSNLTTRDSNSFWTSGQWMTERKGGSDVSSSTETCAISDNDLFRLYGYKWFSSATDSDVALTLARIANDKKMQKSSKPTMFYLETKGEGGNLNNMEIIRLKDKLGTRQLPTAELLLDGTVAHKISDEGHGIAAISDMLNITRLHNSVSAVALMRRVLMLSRSYSQVRIAFGQKLVKIPLHMRALSKLEVETRGCLLLLLKVAALLGKTEVNTATNDESLLLRLLLPVLKLYTAKQAVSVASEGLETFGGQGYMEDTRLPILLRDSQVLPIWEGTTNVMSMDVIRSIVKSNYGVLESFRKSITLLLEQGRLYDTLKQSCVAVDKSMDNLLDFVHQYPDLHDVAARDIAYTVARLYIGALLIENAAATKKSTDTFITQQWCQMRKFCPMMPEDYILYKENDYKTVMEGYVEE